MRSFLSIDLDYWKNHNSDDHSFRFMRKVFRLGLPVRLVQDHEEMLEQLNASRYDVVYNVDYHSDIFGFRDKKDLTEWKSKNSKPECGSWAIFVDWSMTSTFHWMYPHAYCYTHDNDYSNSGVCWTNLHDNPYLGGVLKTWKELRRSKGVARIDWQSIEAISVCLSPDWKATKPIIRAGALLGMSEHDMDYKNIKPTWIYPEQAKDNLSDILHEPTAEEILRDLEEQFGEDSKEYQEAG
jgi:hypothetical protein